MNKDRQQHSACDKHNDLYEPAANEERMHIPEVFPTGNLFRDVWEKRKQSSQPLNQ
jgi:hypothetical protein